MIKQHSWTRQQYENAFGHERTMAWGTGMSPNTDDPPEIVKAAEYSFEASNYDVHGWSNDDRRKRFHAIKYRAFAFAEDIPF